MKSILQIAIGATLALATAMSAPAADEKRLEQCRAINKDLTKLEALRRGGGSARQMDLWKRRIHDKQDQYSKLYCRKYRFEL